MVPYEGKGKNLARSTALGACSNFLVGFRRLQTRNHTAHLTWQLATRHTLQLYHDTTCKRMHLVSPLHMSVFLGRPPSSSILPLRTYICMFSIPFVFCIVILGSIIYIISTKAGTTVVYVKRFRIHM